MSRLVYLLSIIQKTGLRWWNSFSQRRSVIVVRSLLTAAVATIGFVIIIVSGLADLGSATEQLHQWYPGTEMAYKREGELLIVVAPFYTSNNVFDTEPHIEIIRALQLRTKHLELKNVRIEQTREIFRSDENDRAQALAKKYGANVIIWGENTGVRIRVSSLTLSPWKVNDILLIPELSSIDETSRTQLGELYHLYSTFITDILPNEVALFCSVLLAQDLLLHDPDRAVEVLNQTVIDAQEKSASVELIAHTYLGIAYMFFKPEAELAVRALSRVIDHDNTSPSVYYFRALAFVMKGDYSSAENDIKLHLIRQEDDTDGLFWSGFIYSRLGKYDEAIKAYNRNIELDNSDYAAYYNLGNLYLNLGKNELAVKSYDQAISVRTRYDKAFAQRCNALVDLNRLDAAQKDCIRALRYRTSGLRASAVYFHLARISRKQERYQGAINQLGQALKEDPKNSGAAYLRGIIWDLHFQDYDKALSDFDLAIQIDPNDADYHYSKGVTLSRRDMGTDLEVALESYSRAIELRMGYRNAFHNRGDVYLRLGQYENAISDFTAAINLEPDLSGSFLARAAAYIIMERKEDALRDLKSVIGTSKDDDEIRAAKYLLEQLGE